MLHFWLILNFALGEWLSTLLFLALWLTTSVAIVL